MPIMMELLQAERKDLKLCTKLKFTTMYLKKS